MTHFCIKHSSNLTHPVMHPLVGILFKRTLSLPPPANENSLPENEEFIMNTMYYIISIDSNSPSRSSGRINICLELRTSSRNTSHQHCILLLMLFSDICCCFTSALIITRRTKKNKAILFSFYYNNSHNNNNNNNETKINFI